MHRGTDSGEQVFAQKHQAASPFNNKALISIAFYTHPGLAV
jgi:hypothetical protein